MISWFVVDILYSEIINISIQMFKSLIILYISIIVISNIENYRYLSEFILLNDNWSFKRFLFLLTVTNMKNGYCNPIKFYICKYESNVFNIMKRLEQN